MAEVDAVELIRPEVEKLDRPKARAWFGRVALTDHGDHVEFTTGTKVYHWRLPDQPGDLPVVASIVRSSIGNAVGAGAGAVRIAFLDDGGSVLGYLAGGSQRQLLRDLERRILPDSAYDAVRARGVRIVDERHSSEREFYDRHPDPSLGAGSMFAARRPVVFFGGIVLAIIVVALIVMAARGSFG